MKLAAHPLVVAAAMGWLGPAALADDSELESLTIGIHEDAGEAELAVAEDAFAAAAAAYDEARHRAL